MCRRLAAAAALALVVTACSSSTTADPGDTTSTSEPADDSSTTTEPDAGTTSSSSTTEPEPVNPLPDTFTKLSEPGVGGRITSLAFDPTDPDRLYVGGDMLGIAVTGDFGTTWDSPSGMASWEIGDITPTPSADGRIWSGSLSGPHASSDGGLTWSLARNGMPDISEARYTMPIEAVLVDPTDASRLLAFNGNQRNWDAPGAYLDGQWQGDGSVWQSTDSGATWSRLATVAPGGNIRAATFLDADGDLLLAAVANRGVWASTDGGATWGERVQGLPHFNTYDIAGHPDDPNIAWVAMGEGPNRDGRHVPGGIWRTTDGGATWLPVNEGLEIVANATPGDTGSFHQIVVASSDPSRLYTSNVAPGQAAIYRSDDGGDTWSRIADSDTPRPNAYGSALRAFDIAVHPDDPDRLAIGSDDTLLGSTDGGTTWEDLTTSEERAGFFTGRGYTGLVSTDIVFDDRQPDHLALLGFDGGNFIQTIDDGLTWRRTVQPVSLWGGGVEAIYSPTDPDTIYVLLGQFSNFRGIGISTDGGATFELAAGAGFGLPEVGNVPGGASGITALDGGGTDVVLAVIGRQLHRSADGGGTFAPVAGLAEVRDVAVAGDGATVYAATPTSVLVSTDEGATFAPMEGAPRGATELFASAAEPASMYAVAFRDGDGGAFRWDGTAWSTVFDDEFVHGLAVDPTNPDNIAVVTSEPAFHDISSARGVFLSADGGATWVNVNDGLPMTRLRTAEFDPHEPDRLLVGTTGRGFYEISFSKATGS